MLTCSLRSLLRASILALAIATSTPSWSLSVALDIDDPQIAQGDTTQVEVLVARQSNDLPGSFVLTLEVPVGIAPFSSTLVNESSILFGDCNIVGQPFICEPGDRLRGFVDLENPFAFERLSFPVQLASQTLPGTAIAWTLLVEQNGQQIAQDTATLTAIDARVGSVSISQASNVNFLFVPTAYTLHYGNPTDSEITDAVLTVTLPPNSDVGTVTGNPDQTGSVITWDIGTLRAGATATQSIVFFLESDDEGMLYTTSAQLSGAVGGQTISVETAETTVPPVDTQLGVALTTNPSPAAPGETVMVTVHVSPPRVPLTGTQPSVYEARLRIPASVEPIAKSLIPGVYDWSCFQVGSPDVCEPGDELIWFVPSWSEAPHRLLSFPVQLAAGVVSGDLIDWAVRVSSPDDRQAWLDTTMPVETNPALLLSIDGLDTEDFGGEQSTQYTIHYSNISDVDMVGPELLVTLDPNTVFVDASDFPQTDGQEIRWFVGDLSAGASGERRIRVITHSSSEPGFLIPTDVQITNTDSGEPSRRSARAVAAGAFPFFRERPFTLNQQPLATSQTTRLRFAVGDDQSALVNASVFLRLADGMADFEKSAVLGPIDRDASCTGKGNPELCEAGELLAYQPAPVFPPLRSVDISFPVRAEAAATSGQLLTFDYVITDGLDRAATYRGQKTVRLGSTAPITLNIEQSTSVVAGLDGPVYALTYGNSGSETLFGGVLSLTQSEWTLTDFSSEFFQPDGQTATWPLDPLLPGETGRVIVKTSLEFPLGLVATLPVEATLTGFFDQEVQLTAQEVATTVAVPPLDLAVDVSQNKSSVFAESLVVTINLSNPTGQTVDVESLVLQMPDGFDPIPETLLFDTTFDADASCATNGLPDECDAQDTMLWRPGLMLPGEIVTVSFPAFYFDSQLLVGRVASFEAAATVLDAGPAPIQRRDSRTTQFDDGGLAVSVDVDGTARLAGEPIRAVIHIANSGSMSFQEARVLVPVPRDLEFISTSGLGWFNPASRMVEVFEAPFASGAVRRYELVLASSPEAAPGALVEFQAELALEGSGNAGLSASQSTHIGAQGALVTDLTVTPAVAAPGASFSVDMAITNTSSAAVSLADVRLRFPQGITPISPFDIVGDLSPDACGQIGLPAECEANDIVSFLAMELAPNQTVTMSFDTTVAPWANDGSLIPFAVRVADDTGIETQARRTLIVSTLGDVDNDGVVDTADNCLNVPNSDQRDSNFDAFGNACDADLNDDCVVNAQDLGELRSVFFTDDPDADFNGDGIVNVVDLGFLRTSFFGAPGPSGLNAPCN